MESPKLLFTPGPLTTSRTVKQAMLRDLGSRDPEFLGVVRDIRRRLLEIGRVADGSYEAVLMQGSGTFAIESVVSSVIPRNGKLLVLINGAYGRRMAKIGSIHEIPTAAVEFPETEPVDPQRVAELLAADRAITHVGVVDCETSTGLRNPVATLGPLVRGAGRAFIVDAMSSFGGLPLDVGQCAIDFLISSANKCIEGVPGFGLVLARRGPLLEAEGRARTLSLDLFSQWKGLASDGQFRFTPPTHVLLAFRQALDELDAEGGVAGRAARYTANHVALMRGMSELGFDPYLIPAHQSHIITSFRYPAHPNFDFHGFYTRLSERGFIIYPGKVSGADCFRIGTIGHIFPADIGSLLAAIREVLGEMHIESAHAAACE